MHISADASFSVSSHTAQDLNKLPNGRANSQDAPSSAEDRVEDIYGNLHNYIPFGSLTANLRIESHGGFATWPIRNEWQEADIWSRPVRLAKHGGQNLGQNHVGQWWRFEKLMRELMNSGAAVRVFARRHPQDDQKGTFRIYGKIHGENV